MDEFEEIKRRWGDGPRVREWPVWKRDRADVNYLIAEVERLRELIEGGTFIEERIFTDVEPEVGRLLAERAALQKAAKRLRAESRAWEKHRLVQLVDERNELREEVEQLRKAIELVAQELR